MSSAFASDPHDVKDHLGHDPRWADVETASPAPTEEQGTTPPPTDLHGLDPS
jgi:hypothetical protein